MAFPSSHSKTPNRRRVLATGLALPLAGGLAARAEDGWSEMGPFEVAVAERMDIKDTVGGRTILTRAYYPAKPGRYPGVFFSHGFGGSLNIFGNTGRVWASHGYVVLHPTHLDSLQYPDPKVDPADAAVMHEFRAKRGAVDPATRDAFVHILDHPYFIDSRLDDVNCLMRLLRQGGDGLDETVRQRTDTKRMGMSGHSFGAYTTLVVAGAALSPPAGRPIPTGFSGFMSMSGQGPGRMGLSDASFAGMTWPLMATTGTRDFGAAGETPPWRLKPYDLSPPGNKYAVVVEGFRHSDFDPPVGDAEMGARGAALHRLHIDFWNMVLKDDKAAAADLDTRAKVSKASDPVWLRRR
jgi:dienelactone hydrolase